MVNICCLIYYFTCIFKVIGDHYKDKENVEAHWELGIFFYECCTRNKSTFKIKDDDWWYIQEFEVVCRLAKPTEEKLSGNTRFSFLMIFQLTHKKNCLLPQVLVVSLTNFVLCTTLHMLCIFFGHKSEMIFEVILCGGPAYLRGYISQYAPHIGAKIAKVCNVKSFYVKYVKCPKSGLLHFLI